MKHRYYECASDCVGCQYCNGSLAYCTVCKAGEGELPSDCPGVPIDDDGREAIYTGKLDYTEGKWVDL